MKNIQQTFIFGIKIDKEMNIDVKKVCEEYKLDYACAGGYGEGKEVVVGVRLEMTPVIHHEVMGEGVVQPFLVEGFLESYRAAKDYYNREKFEDFKKMFSLLENRKCIPNLWTVSHIE